MSDIRQFGEKVEGYAVPVLNEREIRAAAGILFLATFLSLLFILFRGNFIPIKFVIPFFLADFASRMTLARGLLRLRLSCGTPAKEGIVGEDGPLLCPRGS